MCKYCKKLREIKDLEIFELQRLVKLWRLREKKARGLLSDAGCKIILLSSFIGSKSCDSLIDKIDDYLQKPWIGK